MVERLRALGNNTGLEQQIAIWNTENKISLPQGVGQVEGHFPTYRISIYWGKITPPCQQNQLGNSGCLVENIIVE